MDNLPPTEPPEPGPHWKCQALERQLRQHIAQIEAENARLKHHPVTGLPNRFPFDGDLARALERLMQHSQAQPFLNGANPAWFTPDQYDEVDLIALAIDIGYLRQWNRHGHNVGDKALVGFANALSSRTDRYLGAAAPRDPTPLIRGYHLSGDEFAFIFEGPQESAEGIIHGALEEYRGVEIVENPILRPDADFGAATFVEAAHCAGITRSRRPHMATNDRDLLTLVKWYLIQVADERCLLNKMLDRLALLRELYLTDRPRYTLAAKDLYTGWLVPEDIEGNLAALPEPKVYKAIQEIALRGQTRRLQELGDLHGKLEAIDGDETFKEHLALRCALGWEPFGWTKPA